MTNIEMVHGRKMEKFEVLYAYMPSSMHWQDYWLLEEQKGTNMCIGNLPGRDEAPL